MSGRGDGRRVTMAEAAEELGVSVEAIRKRIQRETIQSDKGPDGRRYVYLDESHREVQDQGSELVEELRDRMRYLERMLEEERRARTEERRRHDTLMAQFMQRIPELEASREPTEAPETVEEEPEKAEPRSDAPGSQTVPQRRSLWRRVFGR